MSFKDFTMKTKQGNHIFSLGMFQSASEIRKTWDDELMPMKLRMVAEKVYGKYKSPLKAIDEVLAAQMAAELCDDSPGVVCDIMKSMVTVKTSGH
jgi:hypothetical protein